MIPEYTLSIDPTLAEEGEELGIFEIANTANPAILLKGIAFAAQETKAVFFADDKKYRIAAPVLIPSKIYRKDEQTGEEYYAVVTPEYIEAVFVDFMANRMGGQVFNEEHDSSIKPPSYILETWMVENPETDKSKTVYGLEVPKHTWFAVQQFTDKDVYNDYVKRGLTGFSIHGHSAMMLLSKQNKTNIQMEEKETKEVEAMDSMQEGAKFMIGDKYYEVKDGVPVEVVEEVVEMAEETKEEEVVEMAEEVVEEEKKDETELSEEEKVEEKVEMMEEPPFEIYSKEEVDAKFTEIFDMIADLKKPEEDEEVEEVASVQMSANEEKLKTMRSKLDKWASFTGKKK